MPDWLKRLWPWKKAAAKAQAAPQTQLQPLILRLPGEAEDSTEIKNFSLPADVEPALNYALRVVAEGMAAEGMITKRQARDFIGTHALVVASRERGFGAMLRTIRTSEAAIKANHTRVLLVRLPVHVDEE
jgi:hypothetical protein